MNELWMIAGGVACLLVVLLVLLVLWGACRAAALGDEWLTDDELRRSSHQAMRLAGAAREQVEERERAR